MDSALEFGYSTGIRRNWDTVGDDAGQGCRGYDWSTGPLNHVNSGKI
jgi:hypothetical protein